MTRSEVHAPLGAVTHALRYLAAALVLLSGAMHFYLWWRQSYRTIPTIGPLFMVNAVAGLLIAAALLWKPSTIAALLGLGFSAATFGGFVLASTRGLFGFITTWSSQAVIAAVAEIGAFVSLAVWLALTRPKPDASPLGMRAEGARDLGPRAEDERT
jgi:hypothetical protein